jgi:hypothetical protein
MTDRLKEVFEEMAKRVGTSIETIDFNDKYWFLKHKWEIKEEVEFKNWLLKKLENTPELIDDLVDEGLIRRELNEMAIDFVIFYGWDFKTSK